MSEARRTLALGLRPWVKYDRCAYSAQDGLARQFNVGHDGRDRGRPTWGCVLHDSTKGPTEVIIVAEGLRTMREATTAAEEYARGLAWTKGASW